MTVHVSIRAVLICLRVTTTLAQAATMARAHSQDVLQWMRVTTMPLPVVMMVLAPSPVAPTQRLLTTTALQVATTARVPLTALTAAQMLPLATTTLTQQ